MLLLTFRAGESPYAIDARRVVEVIPRVEFRPFPHAPAYLAGMLGYRGRVVPVIDFSVLTGAPPSRETLSTRVILTEFNAHDGRARLLGIVAENVSHVIRAEPRQVVSPSMSLDEAPYLGAVIRLEEGLVQLVESDKLLTGRLQDTLFGSPTEPN